MSAAEAEQRAAAKAAKSFEESLPAILGAMWGVTKVDVESTVSSAVTKLLEDRSPGVDDEVRRMRGAALCILGEVFQRHAAAAGTAAEEDDARARFCAAAQQARRARDG